MLKRGGIGVVSVLVSACPAWAQTGGTLPGLGVFDTTGFIRAEPAFSTTGAEGPTGHDREFNMMAARAELKIGWQKAVTLTGFLHLRGWADIVDEIDNAYEDGTDLMDGDDFSGQGWLASLDDNHWILDVKEAYINWHPGPVLLRVGKQQIAYGETIGMRVLDNIQGLDLRRHGIGQIGAEEFSDQRIAEWGLRAIWDVVPARVTVEGFVTTFTPTIFPPVGSPYSPFPAHIAGAALGLPPALGNVPVRLEDSENIEDVRDEPILGGRIVGYAGNLTAQLTFVSRPQINGVLLVDQDETLQQVLRGAPALVFTRKFPRVEILGGGLDYMFMPPEDSPFAFLAGTVAHLSGTYAFNQDYAIEGNTDVTERDEYIIATEFENQIRLSPNLLSMTLAVQPWWHRSESNPGDVLMDELGHDSFNWSAISIQQPFMNGRLRFDVFAAYTWENSWFIQPGLQWKPRGNFQVDLYYNFWDGDEEAYFGGNDPMDEVFMRITRYF